MAKIVAKIDVYPTKVNGGYTWHHESDYKHPFWRWLQFRSSKGDYYEMVFILHPGNTSLTFVDYNQAFWSRAGSGSSPTHGQREGPFTPVSGDLYELKVNNTNDGPRLYRYRLDFKDDSHNLVPWDPIIENQNGNSGFQHFLAFFHVLFALHWLRQFFGRK